MKAPNCEATMGSTALNQFRGPLTAIKINEWLLACEKTFQTSELTDKQKVRNAGDCILPDGPTSDLRNWWNDTDDITTWAAFKERIMEEALGSDWRARALQDFYSTKQDDKSVEDYIKSLGNIKSVIKHGIGNKHIDDFTYKYYMIFNADPALTAKIMDDSGFDIIAADDVAMKKKLRKMAS